MGRDYMSIVVRHGLMASICRSQMVVGAGVFLCVALPSAAEALNVYNGENNGNDVEINLTTTVSYTGLYRVNGVSSTLKSTDGDANFQHGIVGNLFEAVPVLDIRAGNYGAHFSAQTYVNTPYLGTNQNDLPGYSSAIYTAKQDNFASGTRNVDGLNFQFLDAFVFGQHQFDDGQNVALKIGRQTLFWGQSLFFPTDGISGGQAPINVISAQNLINPQAQQIFMPVGQVVATYQPVPGSTIQGYYQFEWEHDLLQGEGAYFSTTNILDKGGSFLALGGGAGLLRTKDLTPERQNGQFGLSFQQEIGNYDIGIFTERFDAKTPEVGISPGSIAPTALPHGYTGIGTYTLVYPRDIWLQGVSLSTNLGAANVAGEFSVREHQPLVASNGGVFILVPGGNANSSPEYPVGNTWDAQVSAIYLSPGIPLDPGGVSVAAEAIVNHLINVTGNRAALASGHQATAGAFDVSLTPTYNNVLPYLQITFPVSLTYSFLGRSAVDSSLYHGVAVFDAGITGTYQTNWIASLSYQDYLGKPDPVNNALADRGYVALNLQHTF